MNQEANIHSKNLESIRKIYNLYKSDLWIYFNIKKFLSSITFHKLAISAASHCIINGDVTYIKILLEISELKSNEFLKALRWFEYRTHMSFCFEKGNLKLDRQKTFDDENYQYFSEFIKSYIGDLPQIKLPKNLLLSEKNNSKQRKNKLTKPTKDKLDLIDSPMKINGCNVYGGYGTGKKR